ncbi:MAG: 50S ribosomal protein L3 [Candidatus Terraquivivens tikiterensis]|uniref:50S ribosomal protein L3 n=1 Tax=Candidatus Terraquivivens tikiterensis TaxID=1980982 RepID=A0A2R7Y583_9ARCH|nr:MAG: 50S ribosomal protein L3 [Candidatus Terraquivivens tikiterensis]
MGHRKQSAPRRGSLAFLPRGRARRLVPRVKFWPDYKGEPRPLGFLAYKAGVTSVYYVDTTPNSPTQGTEVQKLATILSAPPVIVAGIVLYKDEGGKLVELTKIWSKNIPPEINRKVVGLKPNEDEKLKRIDELRKEVSEVRLIIASQPKLVRLPKKKPDILEVKVGGDDVQKCLDYALSKLGKELLPSEVFREGEFVDVIAVTTGLGFQGVVKRYGVKILPRKSRKTKRGVGAIGPWKPPYVMYTIPRSGQMGFHRRTEFNKRVLKLESDGVKLTPKSGFHKFGILRSNAIVLEGSVPGTPKRPIVLRVAARPPAHQEPPRITLIQV